MTKREICEKEMDVLWNALLEADGGASNTMMSIASVMKGLLLDLAAPEEEKSPLAMKWVAVDKSAPRKPCPKCGAPSPKRIDAPGYYCEPCGAEFQVEEELKSEERHPGIIVDPKCVNPPRCLRCGRDAEVVRYWANMVEEWALCRKCGVSFRLKRVKTTDAHKEGEK